MEPEQKTDTAQKSDAPLTVERNTLMGVLSYIGVLVIIPFLVARDDGFVRFHVQQGLVLLVIGVAGWVVASALFFLWPVVQVVNFGLLVLAIIGIINVFKGQEKELPLVGKYAQYFKI